MLAKKIAPARAVGKKQSLAAVEKAWLDQLPKGARKSIPAKTVKGGPRSAAAAREREKYRPPRRRVPRGYRVGPYGLLFAVGPRSPGRDRVSLTESDRYALGELHAIVDSAVDDTQKPDLEGTMHPPLPGQGARGAYGCFW